MTLGQPHGRNNVHRLCPLGFHPSPHSVQRVYIRSPLGVHSSPQSVQRVCTLSPLGVHPSPLRVISENPPLCVCHSVSPEGPTFPLSEACLHGAATINNVQDHELKEIMQVTKYEPMNIK